MVEGLSDRPNGGRGPTIYNGCFRSGGQQKKREGEKIPKFPNHRKADRSLDYTYKLTMYNTTSLII